MEESNCPKTTNQKKRDYSTKFRTFLEQAHNERHQNKYTFETRTLSSETKNQTHPVTPKRRYRERTGESDKVR